jgi:capsular polysaccharide biosynthesis protein
METILNNQITISLIVGLMAKIMMVLLLVMALVMIRQTSLMDRVIKLPVGGAIKSLVWSFLGLLLVLTAIVIIV